MAPAEPTRRRTPAGPGGPAGTGGGRTREIPDKLYFRIGEVARLCEVPAYVLRFWEGEFPQLKPNKGGTGQRLYRRRDVEMALRIKTLLYDEGYTIPGARQAFKSELRSSKEPQLGLDGVAGEGGQPGQIDARHLLALRKELRELHAMLAKPATLKAGVQPIRGVKEPVVRAAAALVAFPKPKAKLVDERTDNLFDMLPPDA